MNEFIDPKYLKPGVAGFEPTNGGVKVRSLTTWRHPKYLSKFSPSKTIKLGKKGFEPLTP